MDDRLRRCSKLPPTALPIRERVQPGAEDQVLPRAAAGGLGETVLRVAAADHHDRALLLRSRLNRRLHAPGVGLACDVHHQRGDGIVEDEGLVVEALVQGAR